MSSRTAQPATRRQQFTKAADAGNLRAQVQIARDEAHNLLRQSGLEDENELDHVVALAGDFRKNRDADEWFDDCRRLKAAYALGIAIGQLVHPDVFRNGDRR